MGKQVWKRNGDASGLVDQEVGKHGPTWTDGFNIMREDEWGGGTPLIEFPNVRSCTTISVRTSEGNMYGAHLTASSTSDEVDAMMLRVRTQVENEGATISDVRLMGAFESNPNGWLAPHSKYAMPAENVTKSLNRQLGRGGDEPVNYLMQEMGDIGPYRYGAAVNGDEAKYFRRSEPDPVGGVEQPTGELETLTEDLFFEL